MDTVVGYVTYIFDHNTVKIHITHQDSGNKKVYSLEEKLRIADWGTLEKYKGVIDVKISLIYNLLCKKVSVKVLNRDTVGLLGKVQILPDLAA